jgi:hypothetical protein
VVKPCNPKRSLPFTETRQPGRAAGPMPYKPFINGRLSFTDVPRRPWSSLRRYCPGASKGHHYIGTYRRPPMYPLRYPAKLGAPRSLIVVSIQLVQRYAAGQASHESYSSKAISKARRNVNQCCVRPSCRGRNMSRGLLPVRCASAGAERAAEAGCSGRLHQEKRVLTKLNALDQSYAL